MSSFTAPCGAASGSYVHFGLTDGVPDTDGSFRVDTTDLSGVEESGSGRVTALQIECVAEGQSPLTLTDTSTGGGVNMGVAGDSGALVYSDPSSGFGYVEFEAVVNCVPGATFGAAAPVAGARQAPAAQPGRLPSTGGSEGDRSDLVNMLMIAGVFALIAGVTSFTWAASRRTDR
jgi:hypothetical protein